MAKIVTLCGSTRFYEAFVEANRQETLAGRIVLSVGCFGHRPDVAGSLTPEQKEAVDALHLEKIEMSDEILVLNVNGYVGASTEREICYAFSRDKKIRWWEPYRVPPRFQKLLQKK